MGVEWTEEQQQVIRLRNRNLLVAAAAGSGKTAVLVERIITMISDEENPVDIDRLLLAAWKITSNSCISFPADIPGRICGWNAAGKIWKRRVRRILKRAAGCVS